MTYALILLMAVALGPPWLLLPAAFVVFWSGSRSAWLSFLALLLLAEWRGHNDRWLRAGAAALLVVLFVAFAPLVLSDRAAPAATSAAPTVSVSAKQITTDSGRMAFLREAAATWLQSPLWGSGWGSYWFSSGPGRYETFHPHNHVAYIATSHGAIGVVLIGLIIVLTIQQCLTQGDSAVAVGTSVITLYSLLNTIVCSMLVAVAVVVALAWENGVAEGATP